MPLYHFVTADLPSNTKAPELDDAHAAASLRADAAWSGVDASAGAGVTEELVGLYVSYLTAVGFLPSPPATSTARPLPTAQLSEDQKQALANVGGRGGTS
jgi:L-aminoadipate-semialdehyde dehydrogenase